jgi:hypothetical protein
MILARTLIAGLLQDQSDIFASLYFFIAITLLATFLLMSVKKKLLLAREISPW